MRPPSELATMTVDDIDFTTNSILIHEHKKHETEREVFPDPVIVTGNTRKSFKNWLKWRNKVETTQSGNYLYLQPNGKPFTRNMMGKQLSTYGKQINPDFQPYVTRHWNAVAMLIRSKLQSGHYDCYEVQRWLGHEKIATTETYIKYADNYYRRYPFDWIQHTLKFNTETFIKEESGKKSKQGLKTSVSNGNTPREQYGLGEI